MTFSRIHKRGLTNSTHTHHTYTLNAATLWVTLNDKQNGWVKLLQYCNTCTISRNTQHRLHMWILTFNEQIKDSRWEKQKGRIHVWQQLWNGDKRTITKILTYHSHYWVGKNRSQSSVTDCNKYTEKLIQKTGCYMCVSVRGKGCINVIKYCSRDIWILQCWTPL